MKKIKGKRVWIFSTVLLLLSILTFVFVFANFDNDNKKSNVQTNETYDIDDPTKRAGGLSFSVSADGTYAIFNGVTQAFEASKSTLYIPDTYMYNGTSIPVKEIDVPVNVEYNGVDVTGTSLIGYKLTAIQDGAGGATMNYITAIVVPKSVQKISYGAFAGFDNVQYVEVPFAGLSRTAYGRNLNITDSGWNSIDANGEYAPQSAFLSIFGDKQFFNFSDSVNESNWYYSPSSTGVGGGETGSSRYAVLWLPSALKKVVISDAVYIDVHAFLNVTKVEDISITWAEDAGLTSDELELKGQIKDYAFNSCTDLKTIVLPDEVSSFGVGAFGACEKLEDITLPSSIDTIPNSCFYGCYSLTEIAIPYSVKYIEAHAFDGCTGLVRVYPTNQNYQTTNPSGSNYVSEGDCYLPADLRSIGSQAFRRCRNLKNVVVPDKVTEIGYMAFGTCDSLISIQLPFVGMTSGNSKVEESLFGFIFGKYGYYGDIQNNNGLLQSQGTFQAADGRGSDTEAGGYYFIPSGLKTVIITGETIIGTGAFMNCSNIVTLVLPNTVTSIASASMNGMSELYSLSIPFVGPKNSVSAANGGQLGYVFGTVAYGTANSTFGGATHNSTSVSTNQGLGITYQIPYNLRILTISNQSTIASHAFYNTSTIKDLTFKNTIHFERSIFTGCTSLEKLTVPFVGYEQGAFFRHYWWGPDINVRNSLVWLFSHYSASSAYEVAQIYRNDGNYSGYVPNTLKEVVVTDDSYIDSYAFRGFSSIEKLTINDEVSYIESYALYGCSGLKQIYVPFIGSDANTSRVNSEQYVFGWLFGSSNYSGSYSVTQYSNRYYIPNNLETVVVGDKIGIMPAYAFSGMNSLISFTTDARITTLGSYSFANCSNLIYVQIPNASYTTVGSYAFLNDRALTNSIDQTTGQFKPYTYDFIPDTVDSISTGGLMGTSIRDVDLTRYKSLGNYAFASCLQITKIDFTGSSYLTYCGTHLFDGCTYLSDVKLTKFLTAYMFKDCLSLQTIDINVIVNQTTSSGAVIPCEIPDGCFYGCANLLPYDSVTRTGLILDRNSTSIERIGSFAFKGCTSLTYFPIPENVVEIGSGAFQDCIGFESVTIPRNVMSMIAGTNQSNGVDDLENGIFYGCNSDFYLAVYYPQDEWPSRWGNNWNCYFPVYIIGDSTENLFTYEYSSTLKGYLITGLDRDSFDFYDAFGNTKLQGTLTFPTYHDGLNVYGIASSFSNQTHLVDELKDIDNYVIPSNYVYLGKDALSVRASKVIDIYVSITTTKAATLNNEATLKNMHFEDEPYYAEKAIVYYQEAWQLRGETPVWKTSVLVIELDNDSKEYTYNLGTAIKPVIISATSNRNIVKNTFRDIELDEIAEIFNASGTFDFSSFNVSYLNNINVGTGSIVISPNDSRFVGTLTDYFTISQYEIDLFYDSDDQTIKNDLLLETMMVSTDQSDYVYSTLSTYSGSTWKMNTWVPNQNLHYLPQGYTFSGTLETTSADSGWYVSLKSYNPSGYDGTFRWAVPFTVIDGTGKNVTSNFKVAVTKAVYIIPFVIDTVEWPGNYIVASNLYEFEYTGQAIVPTPVVRDTFNNVLNPHFVMEVRSGGVITDAIFPSDTTEYTSSIVSFDNKNFVWNAGNQYIRFKVVKANVLISMTITNFVIPENWDYFYYTFSETNFAGWQDDKIRYNMNITGLGSTSRISGTLLTSDWKKGEYTSSNTGTNTFGWYQAPKVYSTDKTVTDSNSIVSPLDETSYYNISLNLYITIIYNTFEYKLTLDNTDLVDAIGIHKDTLTDTYICYGADGYTHALKIVVTNTNNATINFKQSLSDTYEIEKTGIFNIEYTIEKNKFEPVTKALTLEVVKGEYEFSDLSKQYDREPVNPIDNLLRTPKDFEPSELIITYYNTLDLTTPLSSAPIEIGSYIAEIYTVNSDGTTNPHSQWFKDINQADPLVLKFRITPREITIDVNGSKLYDAETWKLNLVNATGDDYHLLENDVLNLQALSKSSEIGTYVGSKAGDFIVNPGWSVINNTDNLGDVTKYYIVTFIGTYEILPRVMTVTSSGDNAVYDGKYHTITVDVTVPSTGYTIYYSETKLTEENDLADASNEWSIYPFYYNKPGEYTVYFKVVASTYKTYYGSEKVIIEGKPIVYSFNNQTVMYDGYSHGITGTVSDPGSALVEYAYAGKDGDALTSVLDATWSTICPMFIEQGTYVYYVRISATNYQTVILDTTPVLLTIEPNTNYINAVVNGFVGEYDSLSHSVTISNLPAGCEIFYYNGDIRSQADDVGITWSLNAPYYTTSCNEKVSVKIMCKNYNIQYSSVDIIIYDIFDNDNPDQSQNYTLVVDGFNGDFDGLEHGVTLSGNPNTYLKYSASTDSYYYSYTLGSNTSPSGISATVYYSATNNYGNPNSSSWTTTPIKYKNVGSYMIYVMITADNCETKYGSAQIVITKASTPPSVTLEPFEFEYSARAIYNSEVPVTTIQDGNRIYTYWAYKDNGDGTYTLINTIIPNPTDLGKYKVKITFNESGNCLATTAETDFEIIPRTVTVEYEKELEYLGQERYPKFVAITNTTDTIILEFKLDNPSVLPINIGTYTGTVSMLYENKNYVLKDPAVEFKIIEKKVYINVNETMDFDGTNVWVKTSDWNAIGLFINDVIEIELRTTSYSRGEYRLTSSYKYGSGSNVGYLKNVTNPNTGARRVTPITLNVKTPNSLGSYDDATYYEIIFDVKVSIVYPELKVEVPEKVVNYTGNAHKMDVNVLSTGSVTIVSKFWLYDPTNTDDFGESLGSTSFSLVETGVYVLGYRISSPNFEDAVGTTKLTILPADLEFAFDPFNQVYDNISHKVSWKINNKDFNVNAVSKSAAKEVYIKKSDLEALKLKLEDLEKFFEEGCLSTNPIFDIWNNSPTSITNAGDYYATVWYSAATNWNNSYGIESISLKQRPLYFNYIGTNPLVLTKVYDGLKYEVSLGDFQYDQLSTMNTLANTGLLSNHLIDGISPIPTDLSAYSIQTSSANARGESNNNDPYQGDGDFEFRYFPIKDSSKKDYSQNYYPVINQRDGDYPLKVIIKRAALSQFDVSDSIVEYSGKDGLPKVVTPSDGELVYWYLKCDSDYNVIDSTFYEHMSDVGYYIIYISIKQGTNYKAWSGTYDIQHESYYCKMAHVQIVPKKVKVSWDSLEETYSGAKVTPKPYIKDVNGVVQYIDASIYDEDGILLSTTYIQTAGNYGLEAFITTTNIINSANYELVDAKATFNMLKRIYLITENIKEAFAYNNWSKEYSIADIETVGNPWLADHSLQKLVVSTKGNPPQAGTYNNAAQFDVTQKITDSTGMDVSSSFYFQLDMKVILELKQIVVSSNDTSIFFDAKTHSPDIAVTSHANGYTILYAEVDYDTWITNSFDPDSLVYTSTRPQYYDVCHKVIYYKATMGAENSTDLTQGSTASGYVEFEIKQTQSYLSFSTSLDKFYNGQGVTPSSIAKNGGFNGELNDLYYWWYDAGGSTLLDSSNPTVAPYMVGTYVVRVQSTVDDSNSPKNYTKLDERFTVTIKERELQLIIDQVYEVDDSKLTSGVWNELLNVELKNNALSGGQTSPYTENLTASDALVFSLTSSNLNHRANYQYINGNWLGFDPTAGSISALTGNPVGSGEGLSFKVDGVDFILSWDIFSLDTSQNVNYANLITQNYKLKLFFNLTVRYQEMDVTSTNVTYPYVQSAVNIPDISVYDLKNRVTHNLPDGSAFEIKFASSPGVYDLASYGKTNPGIYTVLFKIVYTGSDQQFEDYYGTNKMTIEYRDRTYNENDISLNISKVYDALPASKPANPSIFTITDETIPDVSSWTIVYYKAENDNGKKDWYKVGDPLSSVTDAGDYIYVLKVPALPNGTGTYGETVIEKYFKISLRPFTIDGNAGTVQFTGMNWSHDVTTSTSVTVNGLVNDATNTHTLTHGVIVTTMSTIGTYQPSDTTGRHVVAYDRFVVLDQDGVDRTINYTVTINATIEITKATMTVEMDIPVSGVYTYDGTSKYPTATVTNPITGVDYLMYSVDGTIWSESPISFIAVGNYSITVKARALPNYLDFQQTYLFSIDYATDEVTIDSLTREYNGNAVTAPIIHTLSGYNQSAQASWITYYKRNDNGTKGAALTSAPIEVGKYIVEVNYPSTTNYRGNYAERDFDITPCTITNTFDSLNLVYNGKQQYPTYTFSSATYPNWILNNTLIRGIDYELVYKNVTTSTILATAPSNVGTYQMTINLLSTAANNFVFSNGLTSLSTNYNITKCTLTIKYSGQKSYNAGSNITLYQNTDFTVTGLPAGLTFVSNIITKSGVQAIYAINSTYLSTDFANAFSFDGQPSPQILLASSAIDIMDNYDINVVINLTVSADDITYNVEKYEGIYDGEAHTFKFELTMPPDPTDNISIQYSIDGGITYGTFTGAVGTASDGKPLFIDAMSDPIHVVVKVTSKYYGTKYYGKDSGESNYNDFTIYITKKTTELDISGLNLNKTYDDQLIAFPYNSINYTDKDTNNRDRLIRYYFYYVDPSSVGGTTIVSVPINSVLAAGHYLLDIYIDADSNYSGASILTKYEFDIAQRELVVKLYNQSKTYDGLVWVLPINTGTGLGASVTGNGTANSGLVPGHEFSGIIQTKSANAGFYKVQSKDFEWQSHYSIMQGTVDKTGKIEYENYSITLDLEVTISKANFDVATTPGVGPWDGFTEYFISVYFLTNPITNESDLNTLITYTLDPYDTSVVDPYKPGTIKKTGGEWTVYFRIQAPNYNTYYGSEKISITPTTSNIVAVDYDRTMIYNGSQYPGISNLVLTNENDRVPVLDYYLSDGTPLADSPVNAGVYYFIINVPGTVSAAAVVSNPYYFTITQKKIEVDWSGNPHTTDSNGNLIYQIYYTGSQVSIVASAIDSDLTLDIPLDITITNPSSGTCVDVGTGYTAQASILVPTTLAYTPDGSSTNINNYYLSNDKFKFSIIKSISGIPTPIDPPGAPDPDPDHNGIEFIGTKYPVVYGDHIILVGTILAGGVVTKYYFDFDSDGNLLSLEDEHGTIFDHTNLPYNFTVPTQDVPSIDITIKLNDKNNTSWNSSGDIEDKIVNVPIAQKPLSDIWVPLPPTDPDYDPDIDEADIIIYADSYDRTQQYNNGNPVTFTIKVAVTMGTSDRSDDIILAEGSDYKIFWFNNINVTPEDATISQMASFSVGSLATCKYSFEIGDTTSTMPTDVADRFSILSGKPTRLRLKGVATVAFVEIIQDFDVLVNTVTFTDFTNTQRDAKLDAIETENGGIGTASGIAASSKYSIRLGHLYQGTTIADVLAMFDNALSDLQVFDKDDNLITSSQINDPDNPTTVATGIKIRLTDGNTGNPQTIDVIELILMGDIDGDASITVNDKIQLIEYINQSSILLDDDKTSSFYQAGLVSQSVAGITISDGLSIIDHINGVSLGQNDINQAYKPN